MRYCALICIITWLISLLSWLIISVPDTSAFPESYEVAYWITGYFILNAVADYAAYWLIGIQRIRWATKPLRIVLLCSILLHVLGGVGYALDMNYERPYVFGLWAVGIAQALCFIGPWAHRRISPHERRRRAHRRSVGARCVADDWVPGR